jgi:hypothetical protein
LVRAGLCRWTSANPRRKDAIIERFNLDRQSFQLFLEDLGGHLSIVVPVQNRADQPGECENRRALGFIHYERKKTGRITIANACMQPPIDALTMGFSTKDAHAAHNHLVGCRGEGLELAALILSRDRYNMSIAASGCNWRFDMHTDAPVDLLYGRTLSENQVDRVDRSCARHGKSTLLSGEGHGSGDRRDAGQARPTGHARRVFELAPLDNDGRSRAHLPFRYHSHTTWRLNP